MSIRIYANAPATALASSISNSQTSMTVNSATGYPIQFPFTVIIDRGTATEEAVSVTAAAGAVFTITRAIDSTTAFSHATGAVVEHGITAQDIREPNAHINASTAVHGLAGAVVGTTDVQAVSNKDLTSGTNTFPTSIATLAGAQTLTNKTLALGTNTISGTRAQFNTAMTDDDFASLTGTETLTNKTLTSPTINTPAIATPTITNPAITISALVAEPVIRCTSATRPAQAAGRLIYETDTLRYYQSDGTSYRYLGGGNDPTAARAFGSVATTLSTNGVGVTIALGTETYDYGNNFAANTYTVPRAGLLHVEGRVSIGTPAAGERLIVSVSVNGVEAIRGIDVSSPGTNPVGGCVSGDLLVAANDLVTLRAGAVSAVGRNTEVGSALCFLDLRMIP